MKEQPLYRLNVTSDFGWVPGAVAGTGWCGLRVLCAVGALAGQLEPKCLCIRASWGAPCRRPPGEMAGAEAGIGLVTSGAPHSGHSGSQLELKIHGLGSHRALCAGWFLVQKLEMRWVWAGKCWGAPHKGCPEKTLDYFFSFFLIKQAYA